MLLALGAVDGLVEFLVVVEVLGELTVDLAVGLRFALGGATTGDGGQEVVVSTHGVLLGPRLNRHDDVGRALDGRVHEDVASSDELGLLHGLVPTVDLAAHAGNAVGGLDPDALDVAGFHFLEAHVGHGLGQAVAVHRVFFPTDALLLHLLVDEVVDAPRTSGRLVDAHRGSGVAHAAGNVEVAGDGPESSDGLGARGALRLHVDSQAPHDVRRVRVGEQAGSLDDLLLRDPRHLLNLSEVEGAHALCELVEAERPLKSWS